MWNDDGVVLDWMNLPGGTPKESLWESLHDAELLSIQSNLLERTMVLTFYSFYLPKFHNLPLDLKFLFKLHGVQAARIVSWEIWPGPEPDLAGVSYDESERLVSEYHTKWRQESYSWSEFETRIGGEKNPPEISDAVLAGNDEIGIAISFGVKMDDGDYFQAYLRASELTVLRSDGEPINLEDFKKLGHEYWEDFAARKNLPK